MTLIKLVLKLTAWLAFGGGLLWSGKLSLDEPADVPVPVVQSEQIKLAADLDQEISILRAGNMQATVAIGGISDSLLLRIEDVLSEFRRDHKAARLVIKASSETEGIPDLTWEYAAADFSLRSGGTLEKYDNSYLFVAEQAVQVEKPGDYGLNVAFRGGEFADEAFDDLPLYLLLGGQDDDVKEYVKPDPRPGLLLLGGVGGVFIHLFLILIHLLVPWRDEIGDMPSGI